MTAFNVDPKALTVWYSLSGLPDVANDDRELFSNRFISIGAAELSTTFTKVNALAFALKVFNAVPTTATDMEIIFIAGNEK